MKLLRAMSWLVLSISFAEARADELDWGEQRLEEGTLQLPLHESYNPIAGTAEYKMHGGIISIDDAANRITVNSQLRGTITLSLDDAALALANSDLQLASQYRLEMTQSLRSDEGVLFQAQDLNRNGIFDESLNDPWRCQLMANCSPTFIDNRFGLDYFIQYFDRVAPPPPPTREQRAIACGQIEDWDLDFAIDLTEAGLACGLAETPPTFALCALLVGKAAKNQKSRSKADKVCHDPRPSI